ncbi:hypothetical protein BJ138DRAFT_1103671 [Hygrophoropsis aurantiaca]|uniref:Uncharacterized protein n=1 Tax=Hygrophoropsis aurantiaca TaxID=72124 RepID=A0ACB8A4U5_9AGAM|nr:hypothetical protein BJ138DRAFT_1103671 [Hygrophoropsis aurantiaca]
MTSDLATAVDTPPQSLENKKVKPPKLIRAVSRMQLLQEFTRTSLWRIRLTLNRLDPLCEPYYRWRSHQKGPICRIPLSTSPAVKYEDISLLTLDDPYFYTFKAGDRVFVKLEISLAHKFTSPRWYSGRVMKGPIEKEGFIYQEKAVAPAPVKSTEDPETKLPEIIRVTAVCAFVVSC